MWYVYILECRGKALYVGITDDVERRFEEHLSGKGGRYTASNRPVKILYKEEFSEKFQAERRESQIKRWSQAKKLALINGDFKLLKALSVSKD